MSYVDVPPTALSTTASAVSANSSHAALAETPNAFFWIVVELPSVGYITEGRHAVWIDTHKTNRL